jgi:glycosyltransferase involved in cell wall biosynthesis
MTTIRVALIHNIISPYRVPLFEELAKRVDIELFVYFCKKTNKERRWEIARNLEFGHEILRGVTLDVGRVIYHINPSILLKLHKGRFDVIIIGGTSDFTTQLALVIARLTGTKVILWTEDIGSDNFFFRPLARFLKSRIIRAVDALIVPGKRARGFCLEMGANADRVFVAPNAVDNAHIIEAVSQIRAQEARVREELLLLNRTTILYVGQLIERKGVSYLLEAYSRIEREVERATLIVIGDGPDMSSLVSLSKALGCSDVRFLGWVNETTKLSYLSLADLFVLPTLNDVWGLVLNEALVSGLPIVTTSAAGASDDLIEPGVNGLVVSPGNADELYAGILKMIRAREGLAPNFNQSAERAERFSIPTMANGFVKAIEYAQRNRP